MHGELKKKIPGRTRLKNKIPSPRSYWLYTFDAMHIDAGKMYEKTGIKTNVRKRR